MVLSTLQSHGSHSLLAAHWHPGVEPLHTYSPSSPMWAPSQWSSMQWKKSAFLMKHCLAQHAPVMRPPFTFGCNLRPGFKFSPFACAGPRAAALGDEGVGLSGELVSAQHAIGLLPDPCHAARGCHLSIQVQIVTCQVPHIMLRMQAVRIKSF
jgi:hypothetical protein